VLDHPSTAPLQHRVQPQLLPELAERAAPRAWYCAVFRMELPERGIDGHAWVLQDWVWVAPLLTGHELPPFETAVLWTYVRVKTPEMPQLLVQVENPPHAPTQLTGQACVLQACVFVVPCAKAQLLPPSAVCIVTENVLV